MQRTITLCEGENIPSSKEGCKFLPALFHTLFHCADHHDSTFDPIFDCLSFNCPRLYCLHRRRAAAFVGGGFLPKSARGTKVDGAIAIADWYGTLAGLAGVDPTDHSAAASGLPPIDSVDVWPLVIGENTTSPRYELLVDENCLIQGDLKIIRGKVWLRLFTL